MSRRLTGLELKWYPEGVEKEVLNVGQKPNLLNFRLLLDEENRPCFLYMQIKLNIRWKTEKSRMLFGYIFLLANHSRI